MRCASAPNWPADSVGAGGREIRPSAGLAVGARAFYLPGRPLGDRGGVDDAATPGWKVCVPLIGLWRLICTRSKRN